MDASWAGFYDLLVFHIGSVDLHPLLVYDGEILVCDVLAYQVRECESLPLSCVTFDGIPDIVVLDLGVVEPRSVRAWIHDSMVGS